MPSQKRRRIAFSQNFLKYPSLAQRVVAKSSISPGDLVVEIGPGRGILTRELARVASHVVAVEKDRDLAKATRQRFQRFDCIDIVAGDFLDFELPGQPYKVVASIPFNSTASIIRRLTDAALPPTDAYLIVQREAAERFTGYPATTLPSVLIAPWFESEIVHRFRRSDFRPAPRVDSVLLRLGRRHRPLIDARRKESFQDFVAFGFTAWQPELRLAFRPILRVEDCHRLHDAGLDLCASPSQFPVDHWLGLFAYVETSVPEGRRRLAAGSYRRLTSQQAKLRKSHRTRTARS